MPTSTAASALADILDQMRAGEPIDINAARDQKKAEAVDAAKVWRTAREWKALAAADTAARAAKPRTAAAVAPKGIKWQWYGRLAYGKLTITDGNPGVGKSARQVDTAARLSTGRHWPDCAKACRGHEPVNVGIISAEDEEDDTIVPRLMAAGADLTRVYLYDGDLTIPDDMDEFEQWIVDNQIAWIGLDPLAAFVAEKHDLNHDQKTRLALAPLQAILAKTRTSLEGLRHTNKVLNVTSAMDKGSGSRAIGGASRVNLFVARDPKDPDTMVLATVKGNNTKPVPSLTYQIVSADVLVADPDTGKPMTMSVPVISWTGVSDLSADDLLKIERAPSATEAAVRFVEAVLTDGPMKVTLFEKMARGQGISIEGALKTARKRMTELGEITTYREGFGPGGVWMVRLGRAEPPIQEDDQP